MNQTKTDLTKPTKAEAVARKHKRWWLRPVVRAIVMVGAVALSIYLLGLAQRRGWIQASSDAGHFESASVASASQYICPMMCTPPSSEPGRCPVCGMELVPSTIGGGNSDSRGVTITSADRRLIGIRTVAARQAAIDRRVRGVGALEMDESRLARIPAYTGGRVEDLMVNYTGQKVAAGDELAKLYAPDLYAAQTELLTLKQTRGSAGGSRLADVRDRMISGARERLVELGMTRAQIADLENRGQAETRVTITSPQSGTVAQLMVQEGQYIDAGELICEVADLSRIWLMTDLFPEDGALVRYGQKVVARVNSLPGQSFEGRVAFVDPMVNTTTKTVRVRVELENPDGHLRPGDEATVEMSVPTGMGGKLYDPQLAGKWICPRHPDVTGSAGDTCPHEGTPMVPTASYGFATTPNELDQPVLVPRDAVLMAGDHSAVYVETEPGRYEFRRVNVGASWGDEIVIASGVAAGELVATHGNFLIDSQMQLAGNPSLIDPTRAVPETPADQQESEEVLAALAKLSPEDRALAEKQRLCPVTDHALGSMGVPPKVDVDGTTVFLCCEGCRSSLLQDPARYSAKLAPGTSSSVAESGDDLPPIRRVRSIEENASDVPPIAPPVAIPASETPQKPPIELKP